MKVWVSTMGVMGGKKGTLLLLGGTELEPMTLCLGIVRWPWLLLLLKLNWIKCCIGKQ